MPTVANAIANRKLDEFIGICRSMAVQSSLGPADVRTLETWLEKNQPIADSSLIEEVSDAVDDASFDPADIPGLHAILRSFVGGDDVVDPGPTSLPLDDPPPPIEFVGKRFCFTGGFQFGTRNDCIKAVIALGASEGPMAAKTDVLVIGSRINATWKHSSYGTKVASATEWRNQGYPIAIVSEHHWRSEMSRHTSTGPNGGRPFPKTGTPGNPPSGSGPGGPVAGPGPSGGPSGATADTSLSPAAHSAPAHPAMTVIPRGALGSSLFSESPVPHRKGTKARQRALSKFAQIYTAYSQGEISAEERDARLDKLIPQSTAKTAGPLATMDGIAAIVDRLSTTNSWNAPAQPRSARLSESETPALHVATRSELTEVTGRAFGRMLRLPWYVLPLLVFLLSFWTIAAHLQRPAAHPAHTSTLSAPR